MADTSGRKRKRIDDGEHLNKKKKMSDREAAGLPATIKVSSVVRPQFSPPVIATSPGLNLPEDVQFHSYTKLDQHASKNRKPGNVVPVKDLLLHSSSHRTLDYTAREDKPKDMGPLLKHYICVFNPESGKLQVLEAKKMVVRGAVRAGTAAGAADIAVTRNVTNLRNELGEAFGTKKAKKAIIAITENAISPLKGAGQNGTLQKLGASDIALMGIIQGATANMATQEELQKALDQSKPIPQGNFDADDIRDVYNPAEIIGAEVLNAIPISDWQEKAKRQQNIQVPSRFVANRISRVAANANAVQRLRIMRYLLFLIIFWHLTYKGRSRGTRSIAKREKLRELMQPAPEVVIENIRRKFSENGEMRKPHVDLLMTHCCVFASIIDNFETNTFDLREDLKIEQKDINQYFCEIGARMAISRSGERRESWARLALPLQFPKLRQQRRRR